MVLALIGVQINWFSGTGKIWGCIWPDKFGGKIQYLFTTFFYTSNNLAVKVYPTSAYNLTKKYSRQKFVVDILLY